MIINKIYYFLDIFVVNIFDLKITNYVVVKQLFYLISLIRFVV